MPNVQYVSHVRRLCDKKGWSEDEFISYMRKHFGYSDITSRKIYGGETSLKVQTLANLAALFGCKMSDVMEIKSPPIKV